MLNTALSAASLLHAQSASGLTPIIIEIQASEPSHKTYGAAATRMFFGIEAVRVQASAVTFDREQTCCCVAVNGHKIFADMIIASNDVAPETHTLARSTRAMTNGQITVIATGSKWINTESWLCKMLQLVTLNPAAYRLPELKRSLSAADSTITEPLSPCGSDTGIDQHAIHTLPRLRRAITLSAIMARTRQGSGAQVVCF